MVDEIRESLRHKLSDPDVSRWFGRDVRVIAERPLLHRGSMLRLFLLSVPDGVSVSGKRGKVLFPVFDIVGGGKAHLGMPDGSGKLRLPPYMPVAIDESLADTVHHPLLTENSLPLISSGGSSDSPAEGATLHSPANRMRKSAILAESFSFPLKAKT